MQNSRDNSSVNAKSLNNGAVCLYRAAAESDQKTICVLGPPRSGTSMVARTLAYLGVPMGVPVPAPNELVTYEDPDFVDLLHCRTSDEVDRDALTAAVVVRNELHPVWGFKLPMASGALDILLSTLRNPRFVFVFRDPLAIALREYLAVDQPVLTGIRAASNYYLTIMSFLEKAVAPCWLVSYEKAIQNPLRFAHELMVYSGIEVSQQRFDLAVQQIQANHPEYLYRVVEARRELGLDLDAPAQNGFAEHATAKR
jgi:hypothetical protein